MSRSGSRGSTESIYVYLRRVIVPPCADSVMVELDCRHEVGDALNLVLVHLRDCVEVVTELSVDTGLVLSVKPVVCILADNRVQVIAVPLPVKEEQPCDSKFA